MSVRVHIGPVSNDLLEAAVRAGGGELTPAADADAVVCTDPYALRDLLATVGDRARWISLPIAGVDRLITAGIIDDSRTWTATKGVYGDAVAEHAVGLLLACSRQIVAAAKRGESAGDPGWRLRGETVAILGTGGIGKGVATRLAAFGTRCIGVNRGEDIPGFDAIAKLDEVDSVLREARAAVIALPYTAATERLVAEPQLNALGADGVLINVARGEIVDTDALVSALEAGRLGAAGLDVTYPAPLPDGHPLWDLANVVITPHIANPFRRLPWEPNIVEYAAHIERNLRSFATGDEAGLEGRVDLEKGY